MINNFTRVYFREWLNNIMTYYKRIPFRKLNSDILNINIKGQFVDNLCIINFF